MLELLEQTLQTRAGLSLEGTYTRCRAGGHQMESGDEPGWESAGSGVESGLARISWGVRAGMSPPQRVCNSFLCFRNSPEVRHAF